MSEAERRFRPALVSLHRDQQELLEELVDGLEGRTDALEWAHRVVTHTLGLIPDRWYRTHLCRPDALDALTGSSRRAKSRREVLADRVLAEAMNRSYHALRDRAHEYTDRAEPPSPHSQRYVAMRPSLEETHAQQRRALRRGLSPFADREELRRWSHDVREATESVLGREWVEWILYGPRLPAFLGDRDQDGIVRETVLCRWVLPACNRGVRSLQSVATEEAEELTEGVDFTMG